MKERATQRRAEEALELREKRLKEGKEREEKTITRNI
jgi:hypothetical protein